MGFRSVVAVLSLPARAACSLFTPQVKYTARLGGPRFYSTDASGWRKSSKKQKQKQQHTSKTGRGPNQSWRERVAAGVPLSQAVTLDVGKAEERERQRLKDRAAAATRKAEKKAKRVEEAARRAEREAAGKAALAQMIRDVAAFAKGGLARGGKTAAQRRRKEKKKKRRRRKRNKNKQKQERVIQSSETEGKAVRSTMETEVAEGNVTAFAKQQEGLLAGQEDGPQGGKRKNERNTQPKTKVMQSTEKEMQDEAERSKRQTEKAAREAAREPAELSVDRVWRAHEAAHSKTDKAELWKRMEAKRATRVAAGENPRTAVELSSPFCREDGANAEAARLEAEATIARKVDKAPRGASAETGETKAEKAAEKAEKGESKTAEQTSWRTRTEQTGVRAFTTGGLAVREGGPQGGTAPNKVIQRTVEEEEGATTWKASKAMRKAEKRAKDLRTAEVSSPFRREHRANAEAARFEAKATIARQVDEPPRSD